MPRPDAWGLFETRRGLIFAGAIGVAILVTAIALIMHQAAQIHTAAPPCEKVCGKTKALSMELPRLFCSCADGRSGWADGEDQRMLAERSPTGGPGGR